jgi:hypothetical protein
LQDGRSGSLYVHNACRCGNRRAREAPRPSVAQAFARTRRAQPGLGDSQSTRARSFALGDGGTIAGGTRESERQDKTCQNRTYLERFGNAAELARVSADHVSSAFYPSRDPPPSFSCDLPRPRRNQSSACSGRPAFSIPSPPRPVVVRAGNGLRPKPNRKETGDCVNNRFLERRQKCVNPLL